MAERRDLFTARAMDDLTPRERAAVNSQLADVLTRWSGNRDIDCVAISQAMNEIAAQTLRALRERDAA